MADKPDRRLDIMELATSLGGVVRGRDDELAALGSELDRVRAGVGAVVLIAGRTGMGKSRLLAEAARIAERTPSSTTSRG